MENLSQNEQRYLAAEKKVKRLKGYYWHLFWYLIVNLGISISKIVKSLDYGDSIEQAIFNFSHHSLWLFWGIGILFHTFSVFGKHPFLCKDWEDRKMKEFMEKEAKND